MQRKTIAKIIKTKLESWLESITDEALRKEVKDNIVVSGGSICSLFQMQDVNDYDVYIQSELVCYKLAQYYQKAFPAMEVVTYLRKQSLLEKYENADVDYIGIRKVILENLKPGQVKILMPSSPSGFRTEFQDEGLGKYVPLFFSPNAISLSDKVQIVLRFTGKIEEIHKSFDFVHATNYYTFQDGLVTNAKALESILTKQLYYQGSLYPLTTIIRMKKFIKRNWNVTAGEMLKPMYQISELDLSDPHVLEEQILGVDISYFGTIMEILKGKYDSDPNFKMSFPYLVTLIDRVFGDDDSVDPSATNEE